jgi:hypothetical protein
MLQVVRCMLCAACCMLQVVRCMSYGMGRDVLRQITQITLALHSRPTPCCIGARTNAAPCYSAARPVRGSAQRERSLSGPFNGSALKRLTCIWRHALFIPDSDMLQLGQRKCPALRNLRQGKAAQRSAGPVRVPGQCRASAGAGPVPVPGQCPALRHLRQGKTAIAAQATRRA